ncbi:MAG: hypothetical protein AB1649_24785 [Chloroflexota bacterium]
MRNKNLTLRSLLLLIAIALTACGTSASAAVMAANLRKKGWT